MISLLNLYLLPTHDGILKSIRDSVYNDIRFPHAIYDMRIVLLALFLQEEYEVSLFMIKKREKRKTPKSVKSF
jgi:hypothetical protein